LPAAHPALSPLSLHDALPISGETLGPYLHPRGRRTLRRHLAAAGVRVVEGPGATVISVAPDAVALADRRRLTSAVTVWTAGFGRSEEHTSELQSRENLVCRLL